MLFDRGRAEAVGGLRRQQQVVDADAVVLLPGAGLVVPERVGAGRIGGGAHGFRETEIDQTPEGLPRLRLEQRVAQPVLRVLGVDRLRNDVEVAGQNQRLLQFEPLLRPALQPRHP